MPTLQELLAEALRAKNVGAVNADPYGKLQAEYDYASQPPEFIQAGLQRVPERVRPIAELLAPSRADLATMGASKVGRGLARAAGLGGTVKDAILGTGMQRMARDERFWHPIGVGKKLAQTVEELDKGIVRESAGRPIVDVTPFDLSRLEGSALMPVPGDRTAANVNVVKIAGVPIHVAAEGGSDYARLYHPYNVGWASTPGAATTIVNKANIARGLSPSGDVYAIHMLQGHDATNFPVFMTEALQQQVAGRKLSKKDVKQFDDEIRRVYPEFVGLLHPQASEQFRAPASGELRKFIAKKMRDDKFSALGFPDVAQTRLAITDPGLVDVPQYTGMRIIKLDPEQGVVRGRGLPHSTYPAQIPGQYVGDLPRHVAASVLFPEWAATKNIAVGDPIRTSPDMRSLRQGLPVQVVDKTVLDAIYRALAQSPR